MVPVNSTMAEWVPLSGARVQRSEEGWHPSHMEGLHLDVCSLLQASLLTICSKTQLSIYPSMEIQHEIAAYLDSTYLIILTPNESQNPLSKQSSPDSQDGCVRNQI